MSVENDKVSRKKNIVKLFKIIFGDKKELLTLYNALTGKEYKNPDELEINTQEMPDKTELKLSDAFQQTTEQPDVEVVAHMININYGHQKNS